MGKKSAKKRQGKPQQSLRQSSEKFASSRQIPSGYIVIVLIVIGFAIYSNTFNSPFHFDDTVNIVENTSIRDISNISAIWNIHPTRFLTYYTFALNYHFHGLEVFGYHLVNIIIHIAASVFLYFFVLLTFRSPYLKDNALTKHSRLIAAFAALLFLVHPVQTQAVTYIVQRLASMAALFYIASFAFYAKARLVGDNTIKASIWYILFGVSVISGFFTKETSFTLPVMLLLYEMVFFQKKSILNRKLVSVILLLIIFIVALLLYMKPDFSTLSLQEARGGVIEITRSEYLITQLRVIPTYLRLMILPINQNLDYDYPVFSSFFNFDIMLSTLLIAAVILAAVFLFKKHRLLSFGVLWIFIALLPESSIIPISDVMFEHRIYLPMAGFCIASVYGIFYLSSKTSIPAVVSVLVIVSLCFSVLAYKRNQVWSSALSLWDDTVKKSPHKPRPYVFRGYAFLEQGNFAQAVEDCSSALALNPSGNVRGWALRHRAAAYFRLTDYEKAMKDINAYITINPDDWVGYYNRGVVLKYLKQYDNALEDLRKSLDIKPRGETWYYAGLVLALQENYEWAVFCLNQAIDMGEMNADVYNNRGVCYLKAGKKDKAIRDFNKAIELNNRHSAAYYGRGTLYLSTGEENRAISDFRKAIELNPKCAECYFNLAICYGRMNEPQKAAEARKRAEELRR